MNAATTTEAPDTTYVHSGPASWEAYGCDSHTTPHIIVWTDGGRLYVSPECGDREHAPKVAGLLFLAGVPIELTSTDGYDPELTTDPEHLVQVITVLQAAGADLTIVN